MTQLPSDSARAIIKSSWHTYVSREVFLICVCDLVFLIRNQQRSSYRIYFLGPTEKKKLESNQIKLNLCSPRIVWILFRFILFCFLYIPFYDRNGKLRKSRSLLCLIINSQKKKYFGIIIFIEQKYPKIPKKNQKHLKIPIYTQKYSKIPKSTQKYLKVPKNTLST